MVVWRKGLRAAECLATDNKQIFCVPDPNMLHVARYPSLARADQEIAVKMCLEWDEFLRTVQTLHRWRQVRVVIVKGQHVIGTDHPDALDA